MTGVEEHDTPLGPARTHTTGADGAARGTTPVRGTLVLGHGAGGGVESADLLAVTDEATRAGWRVIRVEQPWRVAGKRVAPAPPRLDEAWQIVLDRLRDDGRLEGPVVFGGRSAGARVACRTAAGLGAAGVLALAFPLYPPGRPEKTRAAELVGVSVPIVVVQGETDALGRPEEVAAALAGRSSASVYAVPGDHALKRNVDIVAAAAVFWLGELTV